MHVLLFLLPRGPPQRYATQWPSVSWVAFAFGAAPSCGCTVLLVGLGRQPTRRTNRMQCHHLATKQRQLIANALPGTPGSAQLERVRTLEAARGRKHPVTRPPAWRRRCTRSPTMCTILHRGADVRTAATIAHADARGELKVASSIDPDQVYGGRPTATRIITKVCNDRALPGHGDMQGFNSSSPAGWCCPVGRVVHAVWARQALWRRWERPGQAAPSSSRVSQPVA